MNNGTRVKEHASIGGTNRGVKPPDNVLAGRSLISSTRLTLVTMLTRETYVRDVVNNNR